MSIQKSDIATAINESEDTTFTPGETVFIRTVTYHGIGRLKRTSAIGNVTFLHLAEFSWIPDTERFMNFLAEGKLREVEPCPGEVRVSVSAIVDVFAWNHPLPNKQL